MVKFYVEHVNDFFLAPGEKEVDKEHYTLIAGFYHAFLTGNLPKGKVTGYGSNDSGPKPWNGKKWVDLKDKKVVRVKVKLKYSEYETYVSERHTRKI